MSENILIIGGGSGIGQGLVQHYLQQGDEVQAISRRACPASLTKSDLNWLQLNSTEGETREDAEENVINQAVAEALKGQPGIIFICQGWLHDNQHGPEKTLRQLTAAQMQKSFAINVMQPALYLKALFGYLTKQDQVKVLVLSAKVGSITDNQLGGWFSYRASKAAINMLVKTSSIELGRYNKTAALVSVHPGTTDTALSAPFQANIPAGQLQTAAATAKRLAAVAAQLTARHSGQLLNWDGSVLPF
ncbi:NAD(P)-dependent dehydrogenase, short-chain alcohol dehydrogenase family [Arsukibacterium tuosuense]|uniref:NAD(P)-dependent dehydrogenase, short-chain alcohol dehydrogenase family n=1 Tax=Arsukibacterium tuosuense TaxID=1323745 RepID=A0A285IH51_9GAMM|nr:SDR family NAD(P)-dependent oxidoreductase [Arsukibacterium tuosuense]SNY46406.1 NAD(P)-dependent dehydrogenase, short-chain alcohol dehydrogenase family [Arsukibacterium tuosuense]